MVSSDEIKPSRLIFLDVDGVLNQHGWHKESKAPFDRKCIKLLNLLVSRSQAKIVLSSAWRYLIRADSMTVLGFENMLRTHGFAYSGRLIDKTALDEEIDGRHAQIDHWLRNPEARVLFDCSKYVVLDDDDVNFNLPDDKNPHPLVRTNADLGLTLGNVRNALSLLGCSVENLK